jgi:hypothetical protein
MPAANAGRGVIAKSLDHVPESEDALTVAVDVARLSAQNGLSSTGTSKYTMGQRDIAELAAGQATPLDQVMLQMPGVALDQNQEIHIRGAHSGRLQAQNHNFRRAQDPASIILTQHSQNTPMNFGNENRNRTAAAAYSLQYRPRRGFYRRLRSDLPTGKAFSL